MDTQDTTVIMATEHDIEKLNANVCPVCGVLAGGPESKQPRNALLMHIRRHSKRDDRHKLWAELNYKSHFHHGSVAKTHKLSTDDAQAILSRYFNRPVSINIIKLHT